MPEIQKLLSDKMERINYKKIIEDFPWLIKKGQNCVLSPDADGMLCGLFMSHYLNWQIVGYYDNGKNLILKDGVHAKDCVFLDTEIYRSDIKSIGHHITFLRRDNTEIDLNNYQNCLNPNNLRGRTLRENFALKYPMATIHLLLCIVSQKYSIEYGDNSFFVILQADGTINRFLDKYSENLRDWLLYLRVNEPDNILNKILDKEINLIELNESYVDYVKKFVKEKKDKIPISERGNLRAESFNDNYKEFSSVCIEAIEEYLSFLSQNTGWQYDKNKWTLRDFGLYKFTKKIVKPGVHTFNDAVTENFLSLAITANDSMEYTIEAPDKLP